jgi:ABC-type transporter Mla subunit MlaD
MQSSANAAWVGLTVLVGILLLGAFAMLLRGNFLGFGAAWP